VKTYRGKSLIIFDLDGTLTESKANLAPDMSRALAALLTKKKVAVIGGGTYQQFREQFTAKLTVPRALLGNLFLFPTTSTSFYRYRKGWKKVYGMTLGKTDRQNIKRAFASAFTINHYRHPHKVWGEIIEDRGTQITFSALGQRAPLRSKEAWNKNHDVRPRLMKTLHKLVPAFEVRRGGLTSIDVTKKGIDKAYGVRQIKKVLKIPIKKMLFVGDALYPGGNDYAARRTGVDCIAVRGPKDTKRIIQQIIAE